MIFFSIYQLKLGNFLKLFLSRITMQDIYCKMFELLILLERLLASKNNKIKYKFILSFNKIIDSIHHDLIFTYKNIPII